MDQAAQIDALSKAMSTIPGLDPSKGRTPVNAAVRRLWATELITKWGVSIEPEAATVEAVNTAPEVGNIAPHVMQEKAAASQYIRQNGPGFLAANQPDLAARMAAAKTPEQRAALSEELRQQILANPNSLVTDFVKLLEGGG